MRLLYIFTTLTLLLTACTAPAPAPIPELSFTRYQPINLDISRIEITDEYKSPMRAPNVEHVMPVSPAQAVHVWVKDRIRAVGSDKSLQVIVKDASVTETSLPKPGGVSGFFTLAQDKQYDAKLDVEMRIYGGENAMSEASLEVTANNSTTIREDAGPAQRNAVYAKLVADLMETVNAELEKNIYTYFSNDINYSHGS